MRSQHGGVYVSGPMRRYEGCNFPAFYEAEAWLVDHEFGPVFNPARKDEDSGFVPEGDCTEGISDKFLHEAMRWDVEKVLQSRTIVLLPGWAASSGAKIELAVARAIGVRAAELIYHDGKPSHLFFTSAEHLDEAIAPPSVVLHDITGDDAPPGKRYFQPVPAAAAEVRVVNETTGGAKGSKLARFDLLPQGPLWEVAELYGRGAEKYDARNWEKGYDWSLSFAAMMRHAWLFWSGEDNDAETKRHHMASVAFHAFALIEFGRTHPELDDRPKGIVA